MIVVLVLSALLAFVSGRPSDSIVPQNVVTVPPNCPPGQQWINGECRDVWRNKNDINLSNTITAPTNCPSGQQWINGACRDVWRNNYGIPKNVIAVPPNCPAGQEFINGSCRDVWKRVPSYGTAENMIEPVQVVELSDRNVISVPNQCPIGYKPDALGICREIFRN